MNYYALTEKYLYNYTALNINIENMRDEIKEIDYNSVGAANFEYIGDAGYKGSNVENTVIKLEKKRSRLKRKILELENKLKRIDRSLEALDEVERKIIEQRYFDGKQWWIVAQDLRYSERWVKELRKRAIIKIAIGLWGENIILKEFTNTSPKNDINCI